jgi:GNAT superfamily N-acetyltransferase
MSRDNGPVWRPLDISDIPHLNRIADLVHVELPERHDIPEEKFRLFPQGCFGLHSEGGLIGYGVSHPWMLYSIPPLDRLLGALPAQADCLYIHDVAILPEFRGLRLADRLVEQLTSVAESEKLRAMALVSVYGADVFWSRFGFRQASTPDITERLRSYGPTARYLIRELAGQTNVA